MGEYSLSSLTPWADTVQSLTLTMRRWGVKEWAIDPLTEPKAQDDQAVTVRFMHPRRGLVTARYDGNSHQWPARVNLRVLYLSLDDARMIEKRGTLEVVGTVLAQLAPPASAAHRVLGVPATASQAEIKAAYRRLALEHHPDRAGSDERMKEINRAYQELMAELPR